LQNKVLRLPSTASYSRRFIRFYERIFGKPFCLREQRASDFAGPEPQDLVDMAPAHAVGLGESIRLIPSWRNGVFGVEAAGEELLAGPEARLAPTTFDTWLTRQTAMAPPSSRSWKRFRVSCGGHIISSFSVTERSKEAKRSRHGHKCLHRNFPGPTITPWCEAIGGGDRTDLGWILSCRAAGPLRERR
jgi:hypothetical protein